MPSHVLNIYGKFHWIRPSTQYRDIASREICIDNERTASETDDPKPIMPSPLTVGGGMQTTDTQLRSDIKGGWNLYSRTLRSHLTHSLNCFPATYSANQKSSLPKNFLRYYLPWWTFVTENYFSYCPNIFLCIHQFWSIYMYLNICVKCFIFTSITPQILRIQFSLLRNL